MHLQAETTSMYKCPACKHIGRMLQISNATDLKLCACQQCGNVVYPFLTEVYFASQENIELLNEQELS